MKRDHTESGAGEDPIRTERLQDAIREAGLDALVCALPSDVLLVSGYWPVVGTSIAVASRERTVLIVPEDERSLAQRGRADEVCTFSPASLERLETATDAVRGTLTDVLRSLRPDRGQVGYEAKAHTEPASYVAMHLYGSGMRRLLAEAAPAATCVPADDLLVEQKSALTPAEIARLRAACGIVGDAYTAGVSQLRPGEAEIEAAARFAVPLHSTAAERSGGHVSFMSGARSAKAFGAFARSTAKPLEAGELVLVHCNSQAHGFWTDVTRTFCVGRPSDRQRRMYDAVFAARAAALSAIRPGVTGRDVDLAARRVLEARGFGPQFKHATGHGVGFAAIDHNARPRLHPQSPDLLQVGSVFNVEPAIYIEGAEGMRHCDLITVTPGGAEVLTSFQGSADSLMVDLG